MKQYLILWLLAITNIASAQIPEIWIRPTPNTSEVNMNTVGRTFIPKEQFQQQNFKDVNDALSFVNSITPIQSGPRGQQTSVFTRGTNSNHTLVLLNGMPINDQSSTNGAYDFGQDFLSNLTGIEVYTGPAAANFGPDAIGGAVNFITAMDTQNHATANNMLGNGQEYMGNLFYLWDGWSINVRGGSVSSETTSALAGGGEKDPVKNLSGVVNLQKQIDDNLSFRSTFLGRNTFADIDGHSLNQQAGYTADNTMYALQLGLDHMTKDTKSYITLHTHKYDREYKDPNTLTDNYESTAYTARAEHSVSVNERLSWGVGAEHRYDVATFKSFGEWDFNQTLSGDYNTTGLFGNLGYKFYPDLIGSFYYRVDQNNVTGNNDSVKLGLLKKDITPKLDVRTTFSTGYKNPGLFELYGKDNYGTQGNKNLRPEHSRSGELAFDYNIDKQSMFTVSMFKGEINDLINWQSNTYVNTPGTAKQSGLEMSYTKRTDRDSLRLFANQLNSDDASGAPQLRRPEYSMGANLSHALDDEWRVFGNYKYFGTHTDIHNSIYNNINMPETHLFDVGISKQIWNNVSVNFSVKNLLDQEYQRPHGFAQAGRTFGLTLGSSF